MSDHTITTGTTRGDRIDAYNAGHAQGEIVRESGKSSDATGPTKRHAHLEWEWHEGYHDALNDIYAPERMS